MGRSHKRQVRLTDEEERRINAFLRVHPFFEENFSLFARLAIQSFLDNPALQLQKVITFKEYLSHADEKRVASQEIEERFGKSRLSRKRRDPLKAKLLDELYGKKE